ncbi:helix-turn-helix and ligand-binding sensor domain-containing protein [Sphingobacterium hungaricum]
MIKQVLQVLILLISSLFYKNGFSQEIMRNATPYVKQYNKSLYNAGNQNWGIAVGQNGIIYVANTEGLLSFDGQYWKLNPSKNKGILRSVTVGKDGKIYTGGKSDFGFWELEAFGKLTYTQLSKLVDQELFNDDEIWKIIEFNNKIYFHSFSKCYVYENNTITIIDGDGEPFLYPHLVGKSLYFEKIPSGLHRLDESNNFLAIKDKSLIKSNILAILPFEGDTYLIGTDKDGLYLLDKEGNISVWENQAQDILKKSQINNGIVLYNQYFVFGTIQNGILILNKNGDLIQHINKTNGLQNNTVLSIVQDKQGNVWAGLDNGIDRIEINSPLYYYSDFTRDIGTVYTSAVLNNKIYLGTNQGLFQSEWNGLNNFNRLNFRLIPGSEGQVWDLKIMNNQLICSHNSGAFIVLENQLQRLQNKSGGWQIAKIANQPNVFLQANYVGLSSYRNSGGWKLEQFFPEIQYSVSGLLQKNGLTYWATGKNGVKEIIFNADYSKIENIKSFSKEHNNMPTSNVVEVYKLGEDYVFTSDSGLYTFDNILQKFVRYEELNAKVGSFAFANKVIKINNESYWFINKSHIAVVDFNKNGDIQIDSTSLFNLNGKMMNYYENIQALGNSIFLIGLDNGFALFDKEKINKNLTLQSPIIRDIYNISAGILPIYSDNLNLPNKKGNIRITYATPYYSSSAVQYQFYLEGYSTEWSEWSEVAYNDFTNLSAGNYTFKVRSKNSAAQISEITTLSFSVEKPWFLKWPALIFYAVLLFFIIRLGRKRYEDKLQEHQRKVKEHVLEEQKVLRKRELEENEKQLMMLRNTQLEQELEIKNRELANAAMNIVYKNEMLNNLHTELLDLKDSDGNKLSNEQLRKVNKLIDEAHSDDRDWDLFEKSFNEAHENFFKKLRADFPELVPNDLKLCAYLRLNMSSKEIASLLNITTRGVEIRRYRLRKKLNLTKDKNLTEFLLER